MSEQRLEEFVGERELRQCSLCGAYSRNWEKHHYDYEGNPNATIILCSKCHGLGDKRRRNRERIEKNQPISEKPLPLEGYILLGVIGLPIILVIIWIIAVILAVIGVIPYEA